ncbi:MAG: hypothetical protein IJI14_15330 [Anaerolineaceae bacterium]|nr:hypothetical protein [Anaerolineaceae bacterium]
MLSIKNKTDKIIDVLQRLCFEHAVVVWNAYCYHLPKRLSVYYSNSIDGLQSLVGSENVSEMISSGHFDPECELYTYGSGSVYSLSRSGFMDAFRGECREIASYCLEHNTSFGVGEIELILKGKI